MEKRKKGISFGGGEQKVRVSDRTSKAVFTSNLANNTRRGGEEGDKEKIPQAKLKDTRNSSTKLANWKTEYLTNFWGN